MKTWIWFLIAGFIVGGLIACSKYESTDHGCRDTQTGQFVKAENCE